MIRSSGQSKITLVGRRMFILSVAKAVVVFGIVGRLISLQINESKKYKTLSDKNRFREWKFSPPRGLINDFYGKEIASNKQVYQLHIIPENSENLELTRGSHTKEYTFFPTIGSSHSRILKCSIFFQSLTRCTRKTSKPNLIRSINDNGENKRRSIGDERFQILSL